MAAATLYWQPVATVITGDMLTSVGGNASAYNVTDWWYDRVAQQVKQVARCDYTTCYFIPGNHDVLEREYPTRYIANFGWPPMYQRMGHADTFLLNAMDATNVEYTNATIDVLFTHFPTDDEHPQTRPPVQLIQQTEPKWVVNGHTHVASRRENMKLYGHTFNEMTLPSLNFYRSNRDGGRPGFVTFHVSQEKEIVVNLCEPWHRSVLIGIKAVVLLGILYLHQCANAIQLLMWFLILIAMAYTILLLGNWTALVVITLGVWSVLMLLHYNRAVMYYPLVTVKMKDSKVTDV